MDHRPERPPLPTRDPAAARPAPSPADPAQPTEATLERLARRLEDFGSQGEGA